MTDQRMNNQDSSWESEAVAGRKIRVIDSSLMQELYPRLHWWEWEEGTRLERARLNESRAMRDLIYATTQALKDINATLKMLIQNQVEQEHEPSSMQSYSQFPHSSVNAHAQTKTGSIIDAITACGLSGATDREGAKLTAISIELYRTFRNALCRQGRVFDSGSRRVAPSGRLHKIWISSVHAQDHAEYLQAGLSDSAANGGEGGR